MLDQNFDCAPGLRLEAHERLASLQFENINTRLDKIETLMERLEKRLWMTLFGIVGVILSQAAQGVLSGIMQG